MPTVNILGTRGIPARHGGFETFAERLAPYLRDRGWAVTVYCQGEDGAPARLDRPTVDDWQGIERRSFTPRSAGARGTIEFDRACVADVVRRPGIDLVLGYNTAVFNVLERLRGRRVVMNMDGIEWRRQKWSLPAKAWLFANELIGYNLASVAVADHPEIARHLRRRGLKEAVVIPYGADPITRAPVEPLAGFGLAPGDYYIAIGRVEPENSMLAIVEAFAASARRPKLIMLGKFEAQNAYHRAIVAAGQGRVLFPGAIYDPAVVRSLRFHARACIHGHTVGGTNPSLVEALGAGNAILAHDNRFNRWTAGNGQFFFADGPALARLLDRLDHDEDALAAARIAARARFERDFEWPTVLAAYERCLAAEARRSRRA